MTDKMNKTPGQQIAQIIREIAKAQCMLLTTSNVNRYDLQSDELVATLAELLDAELLEAGLPHYVESVSMDALAKAFEAIRDVSGNDNLSRNAYVATCLDDIAASLESGLRAELVAVVCRGAARAFREPDRLDEIVRPEAGGSVSTQSDEARELAGRLQRSHLRVDGDVIALLTAGMPGLHCELRRRKLDNRATSRAVGKVMRRLEELGLSGSRLLPSDVARRGAALRKAVVAVLEEA